MAVTHTHVIIKMNPKPFLSFALQLQSESNLGPLHWNPEQLIPPLVFRTKRIPRFNRLL